MNELKTKNDTPAEEARPKQSRWRRLPKGGRAAVVALGIVVLLAVTAFLYVNGKLDLLRYNDGSVSEMGEIGAEEDQDLDGTGLTHTEKDMAVPEGSPFADEDVLNILLIGTDERTEAVNDADAFTHLNQLDGTEDTTEFSDDARADSMILVSMDIKDHVIRLVSIERGTGVPILLDGYEDQYDWITHTFRYGGPKLTMKTVEECYNIEVDHFVRVNFNSFVQIVNAVGGVDIDITEMEAKALNWEVPSNSMLIVNHVDPGLNHFDGYTALQYARLRKIDNDWKRVERQRTVIKAVLDQVKNASVMELDNLLNTVLPLIQTNFTKTEIAALLVQLPGFLGCDVQQMSLPLQGTYGVRTGMDNRLMYDPDWVVNIKALQDFLYNDKTAEEVIAATPETAAAEAAGELVIATRETAGVDDPVEVYNNRYLHRVDMTYPLDASDFGPDDYRVYLADTDNLHGSELRAALIDRLYSTGVRVLGVPDGAAAGMLLDDYLQTGNAASLSGYLTALPAAERDSARTLWQQVRASHPGALHAVGLGADARRATVARALSVLADNSSKAPGGGDRTGRAGDAQRHARRCRLLVQGRNGKISPPDGAVPWRRVRQGDPPVLRSAGHAEHQQPGGAAALRCQTAAAQRSGGWRPALLPMNPAQCSRRAAWPPHCRQSWMTSRVRRMRSRIRSAPSRPSTAHGATPAALRPTIPRPPGMPTA